MLKLVLSKFAPLKIFFFFATLNIISVGYRNILKKQDIFDYAFDHKNRFEEKKNEKDMF